MCGSRDWEGVLAEGRIQMVLGAVLNLDAVLEASTGKALQIIHGDCPTGADAITERWATRRGLEAVKFRANWAFGKSAGPLRNTQMAAAGADLCVAFLRGASPGTTDMVGKARARKIPTFVIPWMDA